MVDFDHDKSARIANNRAYVMDHLTGKVRDAALEASPERLAAALGVLEGDTNTTSNLEEVDADGALTEAYDEGRNVGAKLPGGVDYDDEPPDLDPNDDGPAEREHRQNEARRLK
jgi:hypothetical protein